MAQSGFTPISQYYSTTAAAVPTAGNLVNGELALNITDGKIFYKDNAGVVQVIGTKGGVGSSTTTQVLYNSSGLVVGSANLTFSGTVLTTPTISSPSATAFTLQSAGTTAITVDTSQNVGIGTSSPSAKLQVNSELRVTSGSNIGRLLTDGSDFYIGTQAATNVRFETNSATRMIIDSNGNVLVGTTGISTGTFKGIQNAAGGADSNYLSRNSSGTANRQWSFGMNSSDQYVVYGYNSTTFNSGAYIAWGGTSWTASSDERLKDIIEPITDAVNKVLTLRTVIGKYKTDEEGTRRSFLIAQDVQSVFPEAVDAQNPEKLGVSYTDVIPLLVASIKEQQAMIEELKAKVAALEAA